MTIESAIEPIATAPVTEKATGQAVVSNPPSTTNENLSTADMTNNGSDTEGQSSRLPKRKVALLLGFRGTNYHGMQYNPPHDTIESQLFKAFEKAQVVSPENLLNLNKVHFMRAARTDKGVHALGQVISMKMLWREEEVDRGVKRINDALPDDIRIWGICRAIKGFHAKNSCFGRIYEYIIPTYMFKLAEEYERSKYGQPWDQETINKMFERMSSEGKTGDRGNRDLLFGKRKREQQQGEDDEGASGDEQADNDKEGEVAAAETSDDQKEYESMPPLTPHEVEEMRAYRISPERLEKLRLLLGMFVGSKNYHNFTVGKPFWDRSSQRNILSFDASEPFEMDGGEWISLRIRGQSFMLHQIRKMVGFTVLMMRSDASLDVLPKLFGSVRVNCPKAPGLGLFLVETLFDQYNERLERLKDSSGEQIDFTPFHPEMEEFKKNYIHRTIVEEDRENDSFIGWLNSVRSLAWNFAYLTQDGSVPEMYYQMAKMGVYDKNNDSHKRKKERDARQSRRPLRTN